MIVIIYFINVALNVLIIYLHPFNKTKWAKELGQPSKIDLLRIVVIFTPFCFMPFILNRLNKSYLEEQKEEDRKRKIREINSKKRIQERR